MTSSEHAVREQVLAVLVWMLAVIAVMVYPVMPSTAAEIWSRLGVEGTIPERGSALLVNSLGFTPNPGAVVRKGSPLFPRK